MKDPQKTRTEAASRWSAKRFGLLAVVALAVGMAAPMSAEAAYTAGAAEVVNDGGAADPTLSYEARSIQENHILVTLSGSNYEVTDTNPVTAGTGCVQVDPMKASCPAAGIADIRVSLRSGDDSVSVNAPIKATVFGGPGADSINTRNGASDTVACGDDTDPVVFADELDSVFLSCEAIDDGAPPETTIDPASGPPAFTSDTSARFSFSSNESGSTFECGIDGGAFTPCTPSTTYTDLSEGPHSFQVRATDHSGHGLADPSPAERNWTVDTTSPETAIDAGPSGTTDSTSATFEFSSSEPGSTFECSIDGSDFVGCPSPTELSGLPSGPHSFSVRAIDPAGNRDPSAATRDFVVPATATPPPASDPPAASSGNLPRPTESLVLIAGRAVKVSRHGLVSVALNCSGARDCAGSVILSTSKPVRYSKKRRKIVRLASRKFQIGAGRTKRIRVRISGRKMRLLRRLRRVSADVTVRDRDRAGRARVGTRTILLKASR